MNADGDVQRLYYDVTGDNQVTQEDIDKIEG
jgi:hypothetical protein